MSAPKFSDRLATRILLGLVIGAVAGIIGRVIGGWFPPVNDALNWFALNLCDPLGQVFFRLLFFVVIPLVFASLTLGVVQLGRAEKLGPLAARTFGLFAINMAIAVLIGLTVMNVARPGDRLTEKTKNEMMEKFRGDVQSHEQTAAANKTRTFTLHTFVEMFMPRNLLAAVVGQSPARLGDVLPLIVFALLVGTAGTMLDPAKRASMQHTLEIINDLMTRIVEFALLLAPYAVPALIFSVVIQFGFEFLRSLAVFVIASLAAMAFHLFGTMSLMVKFLGKRSPVQFFKAARTVMITAFSTSSSSATLPTSIQVSREVMGVSAPVAGFVLPLGATMNMSGTALFEGCVVLFIAQVFGVDLSLSQQLVLLLLSVLSAVAVAAIPGGSLPLIIGLLANFGVPPEGLALVLGVDRILDMARTVLNVSADVATACIVDRFTVLEPLPPAAAPAQT